MKRFPSRKRNALNRFEARPAPSPVLLRQQAAREKAQKALKTQKAREAEAECEDEEVEGLQQVPAEVVTEEPPRPIMANGKPLKSALKRRKGSRRAQGPRKLVWADAPPNGVRKRPLKTVLTFVKETMLDDDTCWWNKPLGGDPLQQVPIKLDEFMAHMSHAASRLPIASSLSELFDV